MSVGVWKETKDKVEELESQLKQIKDTDSLEGVHFKDIRIHPGLKLPAKFKCPDFENMMGKAARAPISRCRE